MTTPIQLSRGPVAAVHIGGSTGITSTAPVHQPASVYTSTPVTAYVPAISQMPVETLSASQIKNITGLSVAPTVVAAVNDAAKQLSSTVNVAANTIKNNFNTLKPLNAAASLVSDMNKAAQVVMSAAAKDTSHAAIQAIKSIPLLNQRSLDSIIPVTNVASEVNNALARQTVQPVKSDLNNLKTNLNGYTMALDAHNSNVLSLQKSLDNTLSSINNVASSNIQNIVNSSVAKLNNGYRAGLKAIVPEVTDVNRDASSVLSQLSKNNMTTHSDLKAIAVDGTNSVTSLIKDQIRTSTKPEAVSNLLNLARLAFDNIADNYSIAQEIHDNNIKAATNSVLKYAGDANAQTLNRVNLAGNLVDTHVNNMKASAASLQTTVSDALKKAALENNNLLGSSVVLASKALNTRPDLKVTEPQTLILRSSVEIEQPTYSPSPVLAGKSFVEGGGAAATGGVASAIKVPGVTTPGAQPTGKASGSSDNTHYIWKDPKQPGVAFTEDEAKNNSNIQARINKGELVKVPDPRYASPGLISQSSTSSETSTTANTAPKKSAGLFDVTPKGQKPGSEVQLFAGAGKTSSTMPIESYSKLHAVGQSDFDIIDLGLGPVTLRSMKDMYVGKINPQPSRSQKRTILTEAGTAINEPDQRLVDAGLVVRKPLSSAEAAPPDPAKDPFGYAGWVGSQLYAKTMTATGLLPKEFENGYRLEPTVAGIVELNKIGKELATPGKTVDDVPSVGSANKYEVFKMVLSNADKNVIDSISKSNPRVILGAATDSVLQPVVQEKLGDKYQSVINSALNPAEKKYIEGWKNQPGGTNRGLLNLGTSDTSKDMKAYANQQILATAEALTGAMTPNPVVNAALLPITVGTFGVERVLLGAGGKALGTTIKLERIADGSIVASENGRLLGKLGSATRDGKTVLQVDDAKTGRILELVPTATGKDFSVIESKPTSTARNTIKIAGNDYIVQARANGPGFIVTQLKDGQMLASREVASLKTEDITNAFSGEGERAIKSMMPESGQAIRPIKSMMPETPKVPETTSLGRALSGETVSIKNLNMGGDLRASNDIEKAVAQAKASEQIVDASKIGNYDLTARLDLTSGRAVQEITDTAQTPSEVVDWDTYAAEQMRAGTFNPFERGVQPTMEANPPLGFVGDETEPLGGGDFGGDFGGYGGGDAGSAYTGAGAGTDSGPYPTVRYDPEKGTNYYEDAATGKKFFQDETGTYLPEDDYNKKIADLEKKKKEAEDAAKKAQDEADAKARAEAEKAKQSAIRHYDSEVKAEYVEDFDTKERIYYNPDTGSPTTKADLQTYLKEKADKEAADAAAAATAKAQADAAAQAEYERQLELQSQYQQSQQTIYPHEGYQAPSTPAQTQATTTPPAATKIDYGTSNSDEIERVLKNNQAYRDLPGNERQIVDNAIEAARGKTTTTTPQDFENWMRTTSNKAFADQVRDAYDEIFFNTRGFGSAWSFGKMHDDLKSGDLAEADKIFARFTPDNLETYTKYYPELLDDLTRGDIELLETGNVDYLLALKDERNYKKFVDAVGVNSLDTDQKLALFKASGGESLTDKDVTAIRRLYTRLSDTKRHLMEDALYGYEYALEEPKFSARMGEAPTISGRTVDKMNKDSFASFEEFLEKNKEEIARKDADDIDNIVSMLNDGEGTVMILDAETDFPVNVPASVRNEANTAIMMWKDYHGGYFNEQKFAGIDTLPEFQAEISPLMDRINSAVGKNVTVGPRPSKSQLFKGFYDRLHGLKQEFTSYIPVEGKQATYPGAPDTSKIDTRRYIKDSPESDDLGFDGMDPASSDVWDVLDELDPRYRPVLEEAFNTGAIPSGKAEIYQDAMESVLPPRLRKVIESRVRGSSIEAPVLEVPTTAAPELEARMVEVPKLEVPRLEPPVAGAAMPHPEIKPSNYRETLYYQQLGDSSRDLIDRYVLGVSEPAEQNATDLLIRSADDEFKAFMAEAQDVVSGSKSVDEVVAEASQAEIPPELEAEGLVPAVISQAQGGAGGAPPGGRRSTARDFWPDTPEGRGKKRLDDIFSNLNKLQGDMARASAAGDMRTQQMVGKAITEEVNKISNMGIPVLQSALAESDVRTYLQSRNTSQYLSEYGEKVRNWFISNPRASEALDTAYANIRSSKLTEGTHFAELSAEDQQFIRSMSAARSVTSADMRRLESIDAKLSLYDGMARNSIDITTMTRDEFNDFKNSVREDYGAYAETLNAELDRRYINAKVGALEGHVTDPADAQLLSDLQRQGRFRGAWQEERLEGIEYKLTHTDAAATHREILRLEAEGDTAGAQKLAAINRQKYENPDAALSHEIGSTDITDFYGRDGYLEQVRTHYGDNAARRTERAWVEENIDAIRGSDRLSTADQTTLDTIRNRGYLGGDLQKYLDIKNKVEAPGINIVEARLFELNGRVDENAGDEALRLERNAYASKYKKYYFDSIDSRLSEFEAMNPDDVSKVTTSILDAFGDSPDTRAAMKKIQQANIRKRVDDILNNSNVDRLIGGIDEVDRQWLRDLGDGKISTIRASDLERLSRFEKIVGKGKIRNLLSSLRPGKHWLTYASRHPTKAVALLGFAVAGGLSMTPWAPEEVWQMTVYSTNMHCGKDPICLSEHLPGAMKSFMTARSWYLAMPISWLVGAPVIGDIIKSLGLGSLDEFDRNGSLDQLKMYTQDMCRQGTWDCSTQDNYGFGRPRSMEEMRTYYAGHPDVLFNSNISPDVINSEFLKADCSGGVCKFGEGSIFGSGEDAAQQFFWNTYLGGKVDDKKLPDALASQYSSWKYEVFTNKRPDRVPGYERYFQQYLDSQKAPEAAGSTPEMISIGESLLKASPFFKDKDIAFIADNYGNSRVISDEDKQLIESSLTTDGRLDLAKVREFDPNASYLKLEKIFPGQVVPAIQAEFSNEAKTDKVTVFKEAGLLEQNNQLPYGVKAIDVLPSELRSEFTKYNDNPTNFKDSMHLSPTGSLEWTDLTGSGRYASSVVNDMAFNPQTGEYDIAASKLDENGKTNYKINTAEYIKWFNQEGDWKGKSLQEFLDSSKAWVCTFACDAATDSSSSSSKSSGGSSSSSKSSSSGQSGIFVSAGGLEADVLLEGKKIGTTDTTIIPVDPGTYIITITKSGYTPKTQAVTVYSGRAANITVTLYKVSPDICTFIEDIGGPDEITRDHLIYIYCLYKGYTYLAGIVKARISNLPVNMPGKIYYSEVKYLFDLFSGDTEEANALVTAQTVCKYTKGGVV